MNGEALHRFIASQLDEVMLAKARRRLDRWALTAPGTHVQRWRPVLDLPAAEVREMLISPGPEAVELLTAVPFTAVLDVETRRRVVDHFAGSGDVR